MKRLRIFFWAMLLAVPLELMAGEIKGIVNESKTKEPMAGVLVIATSPTMPDGVNTLTDENGRFSFPNLAAGTYTVTGTYGSANTKAPATVTLVGEGSQEIALLISEDEAKQTVVTITASRIPRPNIDASVPVTTLTAEELMKTGDVRVGDAMALLPNFRPTFTTQNSGRFIGTSGISALDLRGQGEERTLVLQNGRRHVSSVPGTSIFDVSTIPNDLLERVDVVTGGNSAVYGSDAIAGVVNFITRRDYDGLGFRGQYGISSHGDRPTLLGSVTAGKNFDRGRGNIAGSAEFAISDPLYYTDREFAGAINGRTQFQLVQDTAFPSAEAPGGDDFFDTALLTRVKNLVISNGGAYTSSCPAATGTNDARRALNCSGVFNSAGTAQFGNVFVFNPDGTLVRNVVERDFRPFGSNNGVGGRGSTLRETGLLQTGNRTFGINLLGSYKVADAFRPFVEAKVFRTESVSEGQPTFIAGTLNPRLQLDNPFLTNQARTLLTTSLAPGATEFTFQRFNTDFAGRGENHNRTLYRVVAGVDGEFLDTWRYEAAFNYGRVDTYYVTRGNISLDRFDSAVDAVRNGAGQIVCRINNDADPTNDDPNCVPLNLFGRGAPSAAALNYIRHDSTRDEYSQQLNAIGYVSGDLGKLFIMPGGGPVAFSLGGEWRRENSFSAYDAFTRDGNTFLNSIANFEPPVLDIMEGFAEIRVPILKELPLAEELTLETAGRLSHYTTGSTGTVLTGNIGAIYSPVNDLRIRGGFAVAVRAPTQDDLYAPQSQTFLNNFVDPCGQQNITANPNRVANCAAAGVPVKQTFRVGDEDVTEDFSNRPASGISGLVGGNPDLFAEKSNSYTIGAVVQPRFAPGLTISVDYYSIDLTNAINTIGAQTLINQCYDSPDGIDNQFCRAITRNPNGTFAGQGNVIHAGTTVVFPTTGSSFLQGPFNYARQNTTGIDTDISYSKNFAENWRFQGRAIVAYILNRDNYTSVTEPNRLTQLKYTLGNPAWNGQLRFVLGFKDFDFSWNLRYVGQMTVGAFGAQNIEQDRPPTNLDQFPIVWYPIVTYSDVRASAKIDYLKARIYIGIDNLFDQYPPMDLLGIGAGDAIYTNTGRFLYFGTNFGF